MLKYKALRAQVELITKQLDTFLKTVELGVGKVNSMLFDFKIRDLQKLPLTSDENSQNIKWDAEKYILNIAGISKFLHWVGEPAMREKLHVEAQTVTTLVENIKKLKLDKIRCPWNLICRQATGEIFLSRGVLL